MPLNAPPSSPDEQLSALLDGRLSDADIQQALRTCEQDDALLARWRDYQLIGDALRGAACPPADEMRFLQRLRPTLAQAAPPAPQPRGVHDASPVSDSARDPHRPRAREAANEPRFRWRWVAGLATVAVAAGLGWNLLAEGDGAPVLALGRSPVQVTVPQGVMLRDAALEELMEVHRDQGAASALPMPSGFLRNATFESQPDPSAVSRPEGR